MQWLEWVGWGGISGVISLVALAVALLVGYIEVRAWFLSPRADDVAVRISVVGHREDGAREVVFGARVIGGRTLYEVSVRRTGGGGGVEILGDNVPVLEARDGEMTRETVLASGERDTLFFIVSWHDRTRLGSRIKGIRFALGAEPLQRWKLYRWPFWPRTNDGRWVRDRGRTSRGMRGVFSPADESPKSERRISLRGS